MMNEFRTTYIWRISLVAAMGGFLFGYDWVVIGGAKPFYEAYFEIANEMDAWLSSWAMSSALVGCLIGAVLSGVLTDRIGRKKCLLLTAMLFVASAIWTATASTFHAFVIARIVGGLGIGLVSNASPIYIAEVAPSKFRGALVSVNQLAIVAGILVAQIVNFAIYNHAPLATETTTSEILIQWNEQFGWRLMFAAEAIPAVLFWILVYFIPESPRFLVNKSRLEEAMAILQKVGGRKYAQVELDQIVSSLNQHQRQDFWELFTTNRKRKLLALGLFLAAFQQWCGINVIFNYSEEIFAAAGFNVSELMLNIVITGSVNFVFTLVAIGTVDSWGRRPLMVLGALGLTLCYAAIGVCFHLGVQGVFVLIFVLVAIAVYAMTLAPITWVLLSEIFPNPMRGAAMGVSVSTLWVSCFLLTITFKPINAALGPAGTFWLYGLICCVGFVAFCYVIPETKGRSLEQIQDEVLGIGQAKNI